jgi:hypothetical protein
VDPDAPTEQGEDEDEDSHGNSSNEERDNNNNIRETGNDSDVTTRSTHSRHSNFELPSYEEMEGMPELPDIPDLPSSPPQIDQAQPQSPRNAAEYDLWNSTPEFETSSEYDADDETPGKLEINNMGNKYTKTGKLAPLYYATTLTKSAIQPTS